MDNKRRKSLSRCVSMLRASLDSNACEHAKTVIDDMLEGRRCTRQYSESLQETDEYYDSEEASEHMSNAIEYIEVAMENISDDKMSDAKGMTDLAIEELTSIRGVE